MKIDQILKDIADPKSIYSEIMDNILYPRIDLKLELISEIAISYLSRPKKIEKVWEEGYGKYFFIRTVINNVKSNTSPFYKNCIKTDYELIDGWDYDIEDTSSQEIELKIEKEEKLKKIDNSYKKINKDWFKAQMWDDYYIKGKTFRQIEEDWDIDHCLVWHTVNNMRKDIKKNINKKNKKG